MKTDRADLVSKAAASGLEITNRDAVRLQHYSALVESANRRFNLVSQRAAADLQSHILDSLSFLKTGLVAGNIRVLDIGSGAGFPGVPLALTVPSANFVLVESNRKKASFLTDCVRELGLENVKVVNGRVEALGRQSGYRESQHLSISRAVASLAVLLEYALPLLVVSGRLIAAKGPGVEDELEAAQEACSVLGGKLERRVPADKSSKKEFVIYQKIAPTPDRFPRRVGVAEKRPLEVPR